MNGEAWQQIVHEARYGIDALKVKAVASNFEEHFYKTIYGLTLELA